MKVNVKRFFATLLSSAMVLSAFSVPALANESISAETKLELMATMALDGKGAKEACYATWQYVDGAAKYEAYIKKSADSSYTTKLDDPLIRQYADYMRVDAVGLASGSYDLKVVALDANGAEISSGEKTGLTVINYDRSGASFSKKSQLYDNGALGAYKADGTLKDNAVVIYVTPNTAKTVSADINTSSGLTTFTGFQAIMTALEKGGETRPVDIRMIGTIKASDMDSLGSSSEGLQVKGRKAYSNLQLTIEGIGEDAAFKDMGMLVRNVGNAELRNFAVINCIDDSISLDTDNTNVWIHNLDIYYGNNKGGDQAKGDGAIDVKAGSTAVTVSYNHFYDTGKSCMLGMKSDFGHTEYHNTYHHNWFDHSDSRHPRIRSISTHLYNNYYDGVAKYGVGVTTGASAFVENNYFRNCKHPMLSSLQGSDIMENSKSGVADFSANGTFSGEAGGIIKAYNNHIEGSDADKFNGGVEPVYYDATKTETNGKATQFDAYLVSSRTETVPSSVTALSGGFSYNNFDTDTSNFDLGVDPANITPTEDVPAVVMANAGRLNGGDFPWTFTTADDKSYEINEGLAAAVKNYTSSVKAFGGTVSSSSVEPSTETTTSKPSGGDDPTTETTTSQPIVAGGYTHNFTKDGSSSTFYKISGSLTTKSTITYNGEKLTKALKMETSSNVTFNAPTSGTLTLITDTASKYIKVDGNKNRTDSNGYYTVSLSSGAHTISKGDSMQLFVIIFTPDGGTTQTTTEPSSQNTTTEPSSQTTTEPSTETTSTVATPIELGEAVTNVADGISVTYDESKKTWTLTDTSDKNTTTGFEGNAAELTIPFESQKNGIIELSGTATPSVQASKWAFLQLKGVKSDSTTGEIIAVSSDANKNLAVRLNGSTYVSFDTPLQAQDYNFRILLNMNTKTAEVTINNVTKQVSDIDVSEVNTIYSTTSKGSSRNVSLANLYVGKVDVLIAVDLGDADGNGLITATDAAFALKKAKNADFDLPVADTYADVDEDGAITANDAAYILSKARNKDFDFSTIKA